MRQHARRVTSAAREARQEDIKAGGAKKTDALEAEANIRNFNRTRAGRQRPRNADFHEPKERRGLWWQTTTNNGNKKRGEPAFQTKGPPATKGISKKSRGPAKYSHSTRHNNLHPMRKPMPLIRDGWTLGVPL